MDESRAIATAIGSVKRWARGGGDVTPEVRAAAGKAVAEWEELKASHSKSKLADEPDVLKGADSHGQGGPEGYIHGFICVRPPCGSKAPGAVKRKDLSVRRDGGVVDKKSGYAIGHVGRGAGGKFEAHHASGHVSRHADRETALRALGRYHNSTLAAKPVAAQPAAHALTQPKPSVPAPVTAAKIKPSALSGDQLDDEWHRLASAKTPADLKRKTALLNEYDRRGKPYGYAGSETSKQRTSGKKSSISRERQIHLAGMWLESYRGTGKHGYGQEKREFTQELHRLMTARGAPDECGPGCQAAHEFLRMVNDGATQQDALYRGLSLTAEGLKQFQPGKTVDIPAASFTRDHSVARGFMEDTAWGADDIPVIIHVSPNAKGLHLQPIAVQHSSAVIQRTARDEDEVVTGGRFVVDRIEDGPGKRKNVYVTQQDFSAH